MAFGSGSDRTGLLGRHDAAGVLVVDDQQVNLTLLRHLLTSAGLQRVTTENDPRVAVERFLETSPDLVLLDLHMPHRDGFEIMAAIRRELAEGAFLPIVVLTGDLTQEIRERALAAGATDFLTMPFDHAEMLLRVRNLLDARSLYVALEQHNRLLEAHLEAKREDERRRSRARRLVEQRIDAVLMEDAIRIVFQPISDLCSAEVRGFEALARFDREPSRSPDEWFEEAGTVGRGAALELAAVRAALAHLDDVPSGRFLSLNLSPSTAMDAELASLLETVDGRRIVLELTEHARVDDYDLLAAVLDRFRAFGIRIAVDDAGAGFAGLRHILRLRPDILKLDNFLTSSIDTDPARHALGTAMCTFAREVGAIIVAEGIETHGELEALRGLEVPWGQGYYFGQPGPLPAAPLAS